MVHKCCVFYLPAFLKGPLGYRVRWMVKGKKEKKKSKKHKSQKLVNNNETEVNTATHLGH